ncbi:epoxide hydrolase [Pseudomonas taiwanensis]|uniref:epoxide hydrolase family protein n=1 Tax=Pseudomonas TaxID=286 RepID=UPI0015C1BA32|nr:MULTISPECIES: epoxide hydrolase family protein [Pseudomonas]MDH4564417.1 epoxide hydrolase [Pseudomonas sp. BN411]MDH4656733.1 epoxide hydrolase [Pseudomonas sp. BN606]MDH4874063.1 epoxide hydrolase [Pseudomonas sp. BN515]NWL75695.1 epoxide hydrolase [Pseudomonas taiwanensis]
MNPTPYEICVPQVVLNDLKQRLIGTRWIDAIEESQWLYGADIDVVREYISYWRDDFDWRKQEAILNSWNHYTSEIDGVEVHFIHHKSQFPNAVPLLLLHGWPSSFVQLLQLAQQIINTNSESLSFDIVIPSLPGYGFSGKPAVSGYGTRRAARALNLLMTSVLGYQRYGVRGGDIGKLITDWLCSDYAERVIGAHLAEIIMPGPCEVPANASEAEAEYIKKNNLVWQEEMSYCLQHMTKPQTLAYGLNDSPVGLLAWILEKFQRWAGVDGDLSRRFTKDELLTNITLYWVTQTIASSIRIYYEFCREDYSSQDCRAVPVAFYHGSKDMFPNAPREWADRFYNVVSYSVCESGGHFLEWEEPVLVAEDLREFFSGLRSSAFSFGS